MRIFAKRRGERGLILFWLVVVMLSGGCRSVDYNRVASDVAGMTGLRRGTVDAGTFHLMTYQRVQKPGGEQIIYVEGDGLAWLDRFTPSPNPTPENPMGLRLASVDRSVNVGYVARPCQYTSDRHRKNCKVAYWTGKRFAEPVVDSVNRAVEALKQRGRSSKLHLVGYSGGGVVAALVAARRDDVLSLRTVAGNMDHKAFTTHHDVTPMKNSLNPPDYAEKLRHLPQIHFVGQNDRIVPASVVRSYINALGEGHCAQLALQLNVSHDEGWVARWPSLLGQMPRCPEKKNLSPASTGSHEPYTGKLPDPFSGPFSFP